MLITHDREKLLNAIIYFAVNTRFCYKTKLFKLLYFLDFEHFVKTGRNVTGMRYHAWKFGPVPVTLYEEIEMPEPDMAEHVEFEVVPLQKGEKVVPNPLKEFNPSHFTKRELKLMEELAREYFDSSADDMVEATHLENLPWSRVYEKDNNKQGLIPYSYAVSEQDQSDLEIIVRERNEIIKNYG